MEAACVVIFVTFRGSRKSKIILLLLCLSFQISSVSSVQFGFIQVWFWHYMLYKRGLASYVQSSLSVFFLGVGGGGGKGAGVVISLVLLDFSTAYLHTNVSLQNRNQTFVLFIHLIVLIIKKVKKERKKLKQKEKTERGVQMSLFLILKVVCITLHLPFR